MNRSMDEDWRPIAESGKINDFYGYLAQHPDFLDVIDQKSIVETPLHVAASAGNANLAMEIATLKPSFARKLNPLGFSPMHLALQNRKVKTVRAIVQTDSELVRVKAKGRVTLLHFAAGMEKEVPLAEKEKEVPLAEKENEVPLAENENVDLLAEFLSVCPSSIEDLTVELETAVHVAVKKNNTEVFKVLFGWLQRFSDREDILEWKDEKGNTALDLATSPHHQPEVVEMLLRAKAKRASEITRLADRFTLGLSFWEKWRENISIVAGRGPKKIPNDIRSLILVVATLIATATYQASLNPPGGYWQENFNPSPANTATSNNIDQGAGQQIPHSAGKMILKPLQLFLFFLSNTTAFFSSLFTILMVIFRLPYFPLLYVSSICLFQAYILSLSFTFPLESSAWTVLFNVQSLIGALITLAAILIPLIAVSIGLYKNLVEQLDRLLGYPH